MRFVPPPLTLLLLLAMVAAGRGSDAFAAATATAPAPAPTTKPVDLKWQKLAEDSEFVKVTMPGNGGEVEALKVSLPQTGGTVRVLELTDPKITAESYGIEGKVKYDNVKGNGYIEMWSHFPDGTAFFSRTLDTSGPMGMLHGKSEWREFVLPFFAEAGKKPSKLVVNVVLPEGGVVWIGPAKLKDGIGAPAPGKKASFAPLRFASTPWWGNSQGGRIGGLLGTILGLYGALIGISAGFARRKRVVIALTAAGLVMSALLLVVGIIAWSIGQPYAVWYPLLLTGTIGGTVMGTLFPTMKKRFEEEEMRRMMALDA